MAVSTASPTVPDHKDDGKNLTILEHLQEVRYRLMICAGALVVAMCLSFYPLTGWVLEWMKAPGEARVENFQLVFTDPLEYVTTYFRVSLLLGIAIAMPVFLWQLLAFVGPGLTSNEKRWAYPIIFGASLMFVFGILFAYYVELPPALNFLLNFGGDVAQPLISVKKYVDFVTRLMFVTGLVFEMPFVVMGLAKLGVVQSRQLLRWWRFAFVGAFILSAIVTPSIDPITQTLVAAPMVVLYFVGIGLAKLVEKAPIIPR